MSYQSPTCTIIVTEEPPKEALVVQRVAIYARVSSHEHRENLERQAKRMINYCAKKGYQVHLVVKEIASGVNDSRAIRCWRGFKTRPLRISSSNRAVKGWRPVQEGESAR